MVGDTFYNYDNEAIACIAINGLLKQLNKISMAKALLILPIFLHDPIIQRLKSNARYRSIDEFVIKERMTIGDLNLRVENFLPITLNSISMLADMGFLALKGTDLVALKSEDIFDSKEAGKRAEAMKKAILKAVFLFQEDDESTFLKFNILL